MKKIGLREKIQKSDFIHRRGCRACNSTDLETYLDMGMMPLVNNYGNNNKYELKVNLCKDCYLSQLSIVVDPDILFSNYFYQSSVSNKMSKHFEDFSCRLKEKLNLSPSSLAVDVASNDGIMLRGWKKIGVPSLGVDPARNLAEMANKEGLTTIVEYWQNVELEKKADVITAANVFAHTDDIGGFIKSVSKNLKHDGTFVLEFPHGQEFILKREFDTIYHEHLSYILLNPLEKFLKIHDMYVFDVEKLDVHGGSLRVYSTRDQNRVKVSDSVKLLREEEQKHGLFDINTYHRFGQDVKDKKNNLYFIIKKLKRNSFIAGYAASAKGNVLINYCGFNNNDIKYVVDDNKDKQGNLIPGTNIPVVSSEMLKKYPPKYLIILSWNIKEDILSKTKDYRDSGGEYICPMPNIEVI